MIFYYGRQLLFIVFSLIILLLINIQSCYTQEVGFDPDKSIEDSFGDLPSFCNYYFPYYYNFDKYFTIVLLTIGFPGNIISFLVWSNKRMYHGNSAAVYLAALSLNDTVVLVIILLRDLSILWQVPLQRTSGSCEAETTISNTFQYASPVFVLAFTLERWLAICQPFLVQRICSVKRALRICIGIILITLVICLPFAYLMTNDESGCKARSDIVILYFTSALEIIFSLVVPLLILAFNCLVIHEMAKIQRAQAKKMIRGVHRNGDSIGETNSRPMKSLLRKSNGSSLTPSGLSSAPIPRNSERRKTEFDSIGGETSSPKFKSTTIMLLVVSFYVIFATLLGGLMYALSNSGQFNLDTYSKLTKKEVYLQSIELSLSATF